MPDRQHLGRILIVDDEPSMREFLAICLRRAGHEVQCAADGMAGIEAVRSGAFDLVVTDLRLGDMDGLEVLRAARERTPPSEVLVVTAYATPESAIAALKQGAYDYLTKPFKVDDVLIGVARALERRALLHENLELRRALTDRYTLDRAVGKSPAMQRVFDLVRRVAPSKANVLLLGESGTGKDVVARAIHGLSPRRDGPFVAVNCGAIPETLIESELFGHVKGAFTGASQSKAGLFRAAQGGTLLLDEVGELPPAMQVKLLRALQERRVKPVGGEEEYETDARILAATNRDLSLAVEEGRFREDLYYRLNVITIRLPPLRDRREDIPLLVGHLCRRFGGEQDKQVRGVSPEAMARLCAWRYPGNVRELENAIERAVTLATGPVLGEDLFPDLLAPRRGEAGATALPPEGTDLDAALARLERDLIGQALDRSGGVRTEAARLLGITLRSLRYRLDKLGIAAGEDKAETGAGETDAAGG